MRRSTFSVGMIACLLLGACGEEVEMQFGKDRSFEYGEKVKAKTLIQNTNAEHIQYPKVNTMKVGKQHLKFEADGKVFQLTITVKDTKAPEIELKQESVETCLLYTSRCV